MSTPECSYFNECSAPLCPLDEASLANCAWFPDEETCRRRDLAVGWIARQRKIARVVGGDPSRGCFTLEMIARNFRVTSALRGLDPDKEITPDRVKAWLAAHSAVAPYSEERKQKAREFAAMGRQKKAASDELSTSETPLLRRREVGIDPPDIKLRGEALG